MWEDGSWMENEGEKKEFISNYFLQLFSSSALADEDQMQQIINVVQPCVTPIMNESLTREFTEAEIKQALFDIGDLKTPGPDGLPAIFYKNFWDVVGGQLTKEVLGVLRGGRILMGGMIQSLL